MPLLERKLVLFRGSEGWALALGFFFDFLTDAALTEEPAEVPEERTVHLRPAAPDARLECRTEGESARRECVRASTLSMQRDEVSATRARKVQLFISRERERELRRAGVVTKASKGQSWWWERKRGRPWREQEALWPGRRSGEVAAVTRF
jgi:hypothetical protein